MEGKAIYYIVITLGLGAAWLSREEGYGLFIATSVFIGSVLLLWHWRKVTNYMVSQPDRNPAIPQIGMPLSKSFQFKMIAGLLIFSASIGAFMSGMDLLLRLLVE